MTKKYTEEDVLSKVRDLTTNPIVLNRRGDQTAEGIVSSLVDLVYKSLNSDIDSVYSLIRLFVNAQVIYCNEALRALEELYELSPSVNDVDEPLDTAKLANVINDVRMASFTDGAEREEALAALNSSVDSYIKSGSATRSSKYSKARCLELIVDVFGLSQIVLDSGEYFPTIVDDYMKSDFEAVCSQNQILKSSEALSLLDNTAEDINESKLLAAVANSLITQSVQPKRDIRLSKFSGAVTMLPGDNVYLMGATNPAISQNHDHLEEGDITPLAWVGYSADDSPTVVVNVYAPPSDKPALTSSISSDIFERSDYGELLPSTSEVPIAGPIIVSSHDYLVEREAEEGGIGHPGYERVSGTEYLSIVDGHPRSPYESCPFLKTCVKRGSVEINLVALVPDSTVDVHSPYFVQEDIRSAPVRLTDHDGVLLSDEDSVEWGLIEYSSGAVKINAPLEIDLRTPVTIRYKYNPLLQGRSYTAVPGTLTTEAVGFEEWEGLSLWENNQFTTVPMTGILSIDDLVDQWVSANSSAKRSVNLLTFEGTRGGTSARLAYPHRRALTLNTNSFAPVWDRVPVDYNEALRLTYDLSREAFGRDTTLSRVQYDGGPVDASGLLSLEVDRLSVVDEITFNYLNTKYLTTATGGLESVQPGDDIHISSPVNCHLKVMYTEEGGVVIHPDLPYPVDNSTWDDVDKLDTTHEIKAKITRDRLKVRATSDDPTAKLTVHEEGLGLSGEASAITSRVFLGTDITISDITTLPGYNVKPGDKIVESAGDIRKPIGHVKSIEGNVVTISATEEGYTYPYQDIEIYSLGWVSYKQCSAPIQTTMVGIREVVEDPEFLVKAVSYLNSGSGQSSFYQAILKLRDNIGDLRKLYLNYDANVVNTANSLLGYFRGDKISAFTELLENCKFSEIAEMTPATLSAQSSVEQLLDQASYMLGSDSRDWGSAGSVEVLDDYFKESTHSLHSGNRQTFKDAEEP